MDLFIVSTDGYGNITLHDLMSDETITVSAGSGTEAEAQSATRHLVEQYLAKQGENMV